MNKTRTPLATIGGKRPGSLLSSAQTVPPLGSRIGIAYIKPTRLHAVDLAAAKRPSLGRVVDSATASSTSATNAPATAPSHPSQPIRKIIGSPLPAAVTTSAVAGDTTSSEVEASIRSIAQKILELERAIDDRRSRVVALKLKYA